MALRSRSSKSAYTTSGSMTRRVMHDVSVPGFEKARDRGTLLCNAADSYKEVHYAKTYMGFKWRFARPGYPSSEGVLANYQTPTWRPSAYNWENNLQDSSLTAWKSTVVNDPLSDAEIAVFHTQLSAKLAEGIASTLVILAEADKTKSMLLKALMYLRRPLKDVLAIGRRMTPKQRLDKVNEWWLEGRYGWRPFVHDVMDVIEANGKVVSERRTIKDRVFTGEKSIHGAAVTSYSNGGLLSVVTRDYNLVYGLKVGQTADYRAGLSTTLRKWGVLDPVGAAWDLVPYSFVVDWFCNIGEMARAIEAYALIDERIGWTTVEARLSSSITHTIMNAGPVPSGFGSLQMIDTYGVGSHLHYTEESWNRVPVTNFIPSFGLRNLLDWAKVVDSAALLRQLFSRATRSRS